MKQNYERIESVLKKAGRPIAPHEFVSVIMDESNGESGRFFVGMTEATLGRRLREMRGLGIVTGKRRTGESFIEYGLVPKKHIPVPGDGQPKTPNPHAMPADAEPVD
jgi:hypothetical protein